MKNIMKIMFSIMFFVTTIILGTSIESNCEEIYQKVPVLMYHHLMPQDELKADFEKKGYNSCIISSESFQEQMTWLHENGWNAITSEELYLHVTGQQKAPDKSFVITFDDGYTSNLMYAYPILKYFDFNALEFVITGNMEETTRKYNGYKLSWIDCFAISDTFEIYSHTNSFHRCTDDGIPYLRYYSKEEIKADVQTSIDIIEQHNYKKSIRCFAYPYGSYDNETLEALKEIGVDMAFITQKGYATKDQDLFKIPRFRIEPNTSMEEFKNIFK